MPSAIDRFKKEADGSFKEKIETGLMALFVGRSGSGKSAAEYSFPGKTYVFDCDNRILGGITAVKNISSIEKVKDIDYDTVTLDQGFTFIDNKCSLFLSQGRNCEYQNFCFDSIVSISTLLQLDSQILRVGNKEGGSKVRGSLQFITPDDYNYAARAFRNIIYKFAIPMIKLGKNVFFSGWIVDKFGRAPGSSPYDPQVIVGEQLLCTNKLAEEIPGYFDEVYYFTRRAAALGIEYTVQFRGEFARTIHSAFPNELNITNKSFHSTIKEYLNV